MADIICKKCGAINFVHIEEKSGHHIAYCDKCGAYVKHIAHDKQRFYIGRYKGVNIDDCSDLHYMEWFLGNIQKISPAMRAAIEERISKLNGNG